MTRINPMSDSPHPLDLASDEAWVAGDFASDEAWIACLAAGLPRLEASEGLRDRALGSAALRGADRVPGSREGRLLQLPTSTRARTTYGTWAVAALAVIGLGVLGLMAAGGTAQESASPSSLSSASSSVAASVSASEGSLEGALDRPSLVIVQDPGLTLFHSSETLTGIGVDPEDLLAVGQR